MQLDLKIVKKEIEEKRAFLLDVREKEEWDEKHLQNARLLPLSTIEKFEIPEDIDKNSKLYLHCSSGKRVILAEQFLLGLGFEQVVSLKQSFEQLLMEGF